MNDAVNEFAPDRPLRDFPWVAFDTETTGLSAASERVVELAAVRYEQETREEFSFLIDPGIPMPPGAQRVHGISDAMVRGRPSLGQVLPDFFDFCAGAVLIAHNAPFDIGFLAVGLQRAGLPFPVNPILDSLELSRATLSGPPNHKLETLVRFLRLPGHEAHRALGDAAMCGLVAQRCLQEGNLVDAPLSRALKIGGSLPGFAAHDIQNLQLPLPLEALRRALRERVRITLACRIYGRDETHAGTALAYYKDERGNTGWIILGDASAPGGERAVRLEHITSVSVA